MSLAVASIVKHSIIEINFKFSSNYAYFFGLKISFSLKIFLISGLNMIVKGDTTICDNYRGITLLSVPSKILGKIIIGRIREGIDGLLREEQAGFRRGRGTTEQLFTLRNIIEQCVEWNAPLYINFADFEKAFDSVHR